MVELLSVRQTAHSPEPKHQENHPEFVPCTPSGVMA
jgi:5,10-methylene-tetrahydrofolate dehydrogenase/methenyl tetrahydrofolate cyclohydrolase